MTCRKRKSMFQMRFMLGHYVFRPFSLYILIPKMTVLMIWHLIEQLADKILFKAKWVDKMTFIKMTGYSNDNLLKWPIDTMTNWYNDQLIQWPIDTMTSCSNDQLLKWPVAHMTSCQNDQLLKWLVIQMTNWWNALHYNCVSKMTCC
jgi:hypothetical protein